MFYGERAPPLNTRACVRAGCWSAFHHGLLAGADRPRNHEKSPKTANFKRFLTHFGHFGAFLLEFWPFFRFFDPLFPKKVLQAVGPWLISRIPAAGRVTTRPTVDPKPNSRFLAKNAKDTKNLCDPLHYYPSTSCYSCTFFVPTHCPHLSWNAYFHGQAKRKPSWPQKTPKDTKTNWIAKLVSLTTSQSLLISI